MTTIQKLLIVGITPYFLEKNNLWFEQNIRQILEARKTRSFFEDNILYLEKDQTFNFSQFLRKLDEMGYEKVQKVEEPGEFSQRGGIIDVFPINLKVGVRFEFFGNKIENIEELAPRVGSSTTGVEDEKKSKEILKKKLKSQRLYSDLKNLKLGDYLVHLDHGIGKYIDLVKKDSTKYYVLGYAASDKLYVPVGLERKLSRYVGFTKPKISRLGSPLWQKTKRKIKENVIKLAKELLEIYAERETASRPSYLLTDEFDSLLSSGFKYEETSDQMEAIEDIRKDLEKTKPMDRIICGDVGFGKTEVALRAAIKVIKSGYQTVMICPTTILANQHFQSFKERLKNFPIKIAMLTRFQTKKEQAKIIKELLASTGEADGKESKIDIIIGTHRLLSNDVAKLLFPKGIGLLIIDDEQRFGVKQKEKLKQMRSKIDILSLSATPIPRTLHLAMSSLKGISLIQTPPLGRLPIKTFIFSWSDKVVKEAIEKEISRKGQVYYLHNRVETIEAVKKNIQKLAPKANIGIAHGRMREKELIKIMKEFQEKKIDVLIATTIIENGLDFPNVNTLIVADSTRLGLSQAYQIRGRIGRSHIQAFAYFLYGSRLSEKAGIRLDALKEAEELGLGFRIALKDLEIRGTGNILGKEQSGNINQIGLNLYCQMLSEAVTKKA